MRDEVAAEITGRTRMLVAALERCDLLAPSALPEWSRLTIACHLRYGAEALARMTHDALAGRTTAYYPGGRDEQRPGTLVPRRGEAPVDVVQSLADAGLVRRIPDPTDGRRVVIEATKGGRAHIAAHAEARAAEVATAAEALTPAERAELARLLAKLAEAWPA